MGGEKKRGGQGWRETETDRDGKTEETSTTTTKYKTGRGHRWTDWLTDQVGDASEDKDTKCPYEAFTHHHVTKQWSWCHSCCCQQVGNCFDVFFLKINTTTLRQKNTVQSRSNSQGAQYLFNIWGPIYLGSWIIQSRVYQILKLQHITKHIM